MLLFVLLLVCLFLFFVFTFTHGERSDPRSGPDAVRAHAPHVRQRPGPRRPQGEVDLRAYSGRARKREAHPAAALRGHAPVGRVALYRHGKDGLVEGEGAGPEPEAAREPSETTARMTNWTNVATGC